MRCHVCGKENIDRARYCIICGTELKKERKPRRLWAVILSAVVCFALLIGAILLLDKAFSSGSNGWGDGWHAAEAVKRTPLPTSVPTPTPVTTHPPLPTPTPRPAPTPTPIPMYTSMPYPTPTPVPTTKPSPTPEAEPADALPGECLEPIDALISFILTGEPAYARKAFPPEYITHTVEKYGYAAAILGGEDGVIRMVGGMINSGLKAEYGELNSIEYELKTSRELTGAEYSALSGELIEYGVTSEVTEARLITLELHIRSSGGFHTLTVAPRIIKIGGSWYIHPADVDKLYG